MQNNKMRCLKVILCTVFACVMIFGAIIPASAGSAYQTYTYGLGGYALYSPDAYTAWDSIDAADMGLDVGLENPGDLITDADKNVYIADTGNNRIVVLDRYYKLKFTISTFDNDQGVPDALSSPQGVFVSEANSKSEKTIWVCDTAKNRIVVFDAAGNFKRIIEQPESALFEDDAVYRPVAMAVDQYNRIYVVSSTTYQGVIVLTEEGKFTGFIGAQAVSLTPWEIIWRRFQTDEQRAAQAQNISSEFNNITINSALGLIYVTTSSIKESDVSDAISSKSTDGTYSPVKLLNANGDEIMRRNGFWMPAGEIDYSTLSTSDITGVSKIIDAAVGPENTWSIIDEKRQRIYTYDFDGNLLFAFGDMGRQLGNIASIEAIAYQGDNMLILDKSNKNFTVFQRTEYGDILLSAIEAENNQDFDLAIEQWTKVLQRNSNFDAAYVGIGQAMYRNKDYVNSLEYFESAYDTANWSNSYKEIRKQWMSDYFLVLILIIVALIVGVLFFFRAMGKINKRVAVSGKKRTFGHEIAYGFYIIFHPFDGFWDLKHEKRGSIRGALFFIGLAIATFFYQSVGQGYLFTGGYGSAYSGFMTQVLGVLVPLLLFVLANWCLTTLFEGEGSFKDVFIASSYCLVPIPLLVIPATVYSNFCISTEVEIVTMITTLAFIWLGLLLFFGTMVTHDYTMGKNVITILGTVVAMVFIMFIAILFTTLVGKIVSLVTNIVTEIQFRM